MSIAGFARKIRYQLKKYHKTKLFWRSWFYRLPGQFERLFQLFLPAAIFTAVSAVIAGLATRAADPVETSLLVNAIGSIGCVFLISKIRYSYDATDFTRLNTIALLPWADRQWLGEFLRGTPSLLIPPICFSLVTLCTTATLTAGDFQIGLVIAAAAIQVLMIASLALYVTSFSFRIVHAPRLWLWFNRIQIAAVITIALLLYPPIAQQAVAWRLPDMIFLILTGWPTAIFRASAGNLSITHAFIYLAVCAIVAIAIAMLAIVRLKKTFKVAEISFGPLGDGHLICQDSWKEYQSRRLDRKTDVSFDETVLQNEIRDRNRLDGFWENQGWLGRWFDADERNVVAMQHLAFDSNRSPWHFFRHYTGLMMIAAVCFMIVQKYLPTVLAYVLLFLFAPRAWGIFSDTTDPLVASYRSLPLLANQWLWPPVKYQFLRLIMLVPPAAILATIVLVSMGSSHADTMQILSIIVTAPFIIMPVMQLVLHCHETCDRLRGLRTLVAVLVVVPIIIVTIASVIGQLALGWPTNLLCLPLVFTSIAIFWKLICYWHDKGPVDHYVAPKK